VRRRLTIALLLTLTTALAAAAQQPSVPDLKTAIDSLGAFQYPVRMNAARAIRRADAQQAVPALVAAVKGHTDQFVRYRALVLLTAFNDRGTPDLMRSLLGDRNDRVREVVYRYFAAKPEPAMAPALLAALQTEQAEFVRPALVSALAALGNDPQVQRALVAEAGRGLDFFRIAVIEALGERRAAYAVDTIAEAAKLEGPLQDDAVIALGRIGDARATAALKGLAPQGAELTASLHAANCLLGSDCAARIKALLDVAGGQRSSPQAARASIAALGVIAVKPEPAATTALFSLARTSGGLTAEATVAFSVVAVRTPEPFLTWLEAMDDANRTAAIEVLRNGFERLEEDWAEEQFFAAARAAYWAAAEASPTRTRIAGLIEQLDF
jgi:HEAT repeat protein